MKPYFRFVSLSFDVVNARVAGGDRSQRRHRTRRLQRFGLVELTTVVPVTQTVGKDARQGPARVEMVEVEGDGGGNKDAGTADSGDASVSAGPGPNE